MKNILVLMSGSIAAYKVCNVLSQLKQRGHNVKVVMSEASQKFVGATTVEGLIGEPPIIDMYQSGTVMDHIRLTRWADVTILAPATANTINKFSAGVGDDLITTLFLASDFSKPFLIAPAMNTKMYFHPTTQKAIATLKDMGCQILEAASGILACGEVGYGRLLEPELILKAVEEAVGIKPQSGAAKSTKKAIKILITGGGTSEPIDDVRSITNKSTGKTAAILADSLLEYGFEVSGLFAKNSIKPMNVSEIKNFETFADLENLLKTELQNQYDVVIHAAAVSDYSVDNSKSGKISSDQDSLTLNLKRNPKLIEQIKKQSPQTVLVGFKLTSAAESSQVQSKVQKLFNSAKCDLVVHNDWQAMKNGPHQFNIWTKQNVQSAQFEKLGIDELISELAKKITTVGAVS